MPTTSAVIRAQFMIRSELEVIHVPTGTALVAYPYNNPDDVLASVKVIWSPSGAPADADVVEKIQIIGRQLLLEQARLATENHYMRHVA